MSGLTYLASPYSAADANVREARWRAVTRVAAMLMRDGHLIYSPIAHSHHMATEFGLPTDWQFWQRHDEAILRGCSKLIVLRLPGWEDSVGVRAEVALARSMMIQIEHMDFSTNETTDGAGTT